jgi:hypothetical protein
LYAQLEIPRVFDIAEKSKKEKKGTSGINPPG